MAKEYVDDMPTPLQLNSLVAGPAFDRRAPIHSATAFYGILYVFVGRPKMRKPILFPGLDILVASCTSSVIQ